MPLPHQMESGFIVKAAPPCYFVAEKWRGVGAGSFFMWLSISNAVALMTQYYGATLEHDELIEQFFILSTALFAVEAGAKVTAFGFKVRSLGSRRYDLA